MSQREIAIQLILDEVGKGHTIDEAVQRIINRPKEQPMSDTLLEPEDQTGEHQVNRSGVCQIPGCPCRGWSAQETTTSYHLFRPSQLNAHRCQVCGEYESNSVHGTTTSEHQPAARGGGERVKVELINGVEGQCIGINDYRICGPKPWGGGSVAQSWTTDKNDILRAFLTPDEKHAWLADDLQVVSVKQHQSLVAERESYAQLLKAAKSLIAMNNCNYGRSAMRERGGFIELEKAVEAIEQRSTSE